jgi:hypothetical protein
LASVVAAPDAPHERVVVMRPLATGVHRIDGDRVRLLDGDPRALGPSGTLFSHTPFAAGARCLGDTVVATVVSSARLYDRRGGLAAHGRAIRDHVQVRRCS